MVSDFWLGFYLGVLTAIALLAVGCWLGVLLYSLKEWLSEKLKSFRNRGV